MTGTTAYGDKVNLNISSEWQQNDWRQIFKALDTISIKEIQPKGMDL